MKIDEVLSALIQNIDKIVSEQELLEKLKRSAQTKKPLRVKLGIDASGPDIHLGFAVVLRKLRQF
ncbi:MAG: tyrosine--tRNA ligase, partial [candidate division WOR-3 bacterium]|nr:tyrosine--tRNA ligase [candidate division WOR-3 bacterium]